MDGRADVPVGTYPGREHDEMLAADGAVHEGWAELAALLDRSPPAGLAADTRRLLADEGVTYRPPGEDEQPWALDPLPLPLSAATWAELEAGVAQRALLLDHLLVDLYGPRSPHDRDHPLHPEQDRRRAGLPAGPV